MSGLFLLASAFVQYQRKNKVIQFNSKNLAIWSRAFAVGHPAIWSRAFRVGLPSIWSRAFRVGHAAIWSRALGAGQPAIRARVQGSNDCCLAKLSNVN